VCRSTSLTWNGARGKCSHPGPQAVFLGRHELRALVCDGAAGVRDLLTGITDDLAHVMALAGARSVAEIPEVTGPLTGNSLDT
jgi:isopentenyl diphosphate isomerase/L-lactate dehydrogenase-like FMN-dependent dehydrogenase